MSSYLDSQVQEYTLTQLKLLLQDTIPHKLTNLAKKLQANAISSEESQRTHMIERPKRCKEANILCQVWEEPEVVDTHS